MISHSLHLILKNEMNHSQVTCPSIENFLLCAAKAVISRALLEPCYRSHWAQVSLIFLGLVAEGPHCLSSSSDLLYLLEYGLYTPQFAHILTNPGIYDAIWGISALFSHV